MLTLEVHRRRNSTKFSTIIHTFLTVLHIRSCVSSFFFLVMASIQLCWSAISEKKNSRLLLFPILQQILLFRHLWMCDSRPASARFIDRPISRPIRWLLAVVEAIIVEFDATGDAVGLLIERCAMSFSVMFHFLEFKIGAKYTSQQHD